MVNRLVRVSEASLIRELEILTRGDFDKDDLQALTNARMKAIQQFELLEGRATSRDLGAEQLLDAVALAFQAVIGLVVERAGQELADALSEMFVHSLREAREQAQQLALTPPPEGVEYGEVIAEQESS